MKRQREGSPFARIEERVAKICGGGILKGTPKRSQFQIQEPPPPLPLAMRLLRSFASTARGLNTQIKVEFPGMTLLALQSPLLPR